MDSLVKLDKATQMLAEIKSVDDAKNLIDIAEAARVYAKQVKLGLEAQNHAAEIKLRAQRRAGELLDAMPKAQGGEYKNTGKGYIPVNAPPRLEDIGVTKIQSSQWQAIASIPDDEFEEKITEVKQSEEEITTAGMVRYAKDKKQPHVSHNSGENEWYTPAEFIEAARRVMGEIDLDPASSDIAQETVKANKYYTIDDDGLEQEWSGRVWIKRYRTGKATNEGYETTGVLVPIEEFVKYSNRKYSVK